MTRIKGKMDMESNYLGIDPGLAGGLAVVSGDRIRYKMAMPTITFTIKKGKTKSEIDREAILSFLAMLPKHTHVAIEEVIGFRNQNIRASCTTCKIYGIMLMGLSFAHLYITELPSDTWQEHFGIVSVKKGGGESTKVQAARIAHTLYPDVDFTKTERARIAHDGIVDAVLIANYCQARFAQFQNPAEET